MPEENQELTPEEQEAERDEISKEVFGEEEGGEITPQLEEEPVVAKEVEDEDLWAGVNPTLRAEFEGLKEKSGQVDVLNERLKQAEKRIGSITNQLHESKEAAAEAAKELEKEKGKGDAPTEEEIAAAETDAEWKELEADFPEWAEAMNKRLASERTTVLAQVDDLKKEVTALKESGSGSDLKPEIKVLSKQIVTLAHKNWRETVKTEEWNNWLEGQSDDIKSKSGSWDPGEAIEVLDKFAKERKGPVKKSAAQIAEDRRRRLQAGENPSKGRIRQPAKRLDDMTDEEFRDHAAQEEWAET